ncbi:hypothetical protein PCCS19_36320 [Paenibacillus sp. CCS19]|uniref:dynamin family protein n=1 Tax=Paenibacillus sp. CCS19 TaxID=3158387 RepID=UPI00255F6258|nr:dynamin family protein [Paenibacillus cellulosilyticus]GMK40576.1 hypothetical protein PCCS19_36320 [Paenibacillus cellulosilyticus]
MTGINLSSYLERRQRIIDSLMEVQWIAQELQVDSAIEVLQATKQGLLDDVFRMVVVGEFSRGKSAFVNGLLGKRILPSSPVPTTTVLSKIHYSKEPYYRLHYRDGRSEASISESAFRTIVAPDEPDPDDQHAIVEYSAKLEQMTEIAYAEIGYPTSICEGGVELIDTPGTNELDAAREEITYTFIPQADTAIFVLSARHPLSETEMRFFQDRILKADIQKVFFVVNFKDRLATDEARNKVMQFIISRLSPIIKDLKIFLVSAKQALDARRAPAGEPVEGAIAALEQSGYMELESAIGTFLSEERGKVKLAKPLERTIRIAKELQMNAIRLPLSTVGINLEQLERKTNEVQGELDRAQRIASETIQRLRTALDSGGLQIRSQWETGLHRVATLAVEAVTNYTGNLQSDEIASAVEAVVAPAQTALQEQIRAAQGALLQEEIDRANRRLEQEWESIEQTIVRTFVLSADEAGTEDEQFRAHYDHDEVVIKTGIGSLGLLGAVIGFHVALPLAIPALLFGGGFIYSYFENKVREKTLAEVRVQVERRYRDVIPSMCSDFSSQWTKQVNQIVTQFDEEVHRKIDSIARQLKRMMEERSKEAGHVEQRRNHLLQLNSRLDITVSRLTALSAELENGGTVAQSVAAGGIGS